MVLESSIVPGLCVPVRDSGLQKWKLLHEYDRTIAVWKPVAADAGGPADDQGHCHFFVVGGTK